MRISVYSDNVDKSVLIKFEIPLPRARNHFDNEKGGYVYHCF